MRQLIFEISHKKNYSERASCYQRSKKFMRAVGVAENLHQSNNHII